MGEETGHGLLRILASEFEKLRERWSGSSHDFSLEKFKGRVLEVEDVHFHFDSAVMLPDHADDTGSEPDSDAADDANRVTGLDVLRACYLHAERMPSNVLLIAGHTDRSGKEDYNLKLSKDRADNVHYLLAGKRDEWAALSAKRHQTEDVQQILIWIRSEFGWSTDPGPKNNQMNAKTQAAIRKFQETYNENFDPDIKVTGTAKDVDTWKAFFDMYMMGLRLRMITDDAGLDRYRAKLKFLDASRPTVGCGENHPITPDTKEYQKSGLDRRVHALFFDPPEVPTLDCHPPGGGCTAALCDIYGPRSIFTFDPLPADPASVARNFRVRLELGDIDLLFPDVAANTSADPGVRQRLQAAGFLYEPLGSAVIDAVAQAAWDHFKEVVGAADDAGAVDKLRQMVREETVSGNALPEPGDFAKVRVPGTWCVTRADHGSFFGTPGTAPGVPHKRFQAEQAAWDANPSLGLVPVVAIVEARTGEVWGAAPAGIHIHFQLLPPKEPPAGSETGPPALRTAHVSSTNNLTDNTKTPPVATPVTFNMTGSPDAFVKGERARIAPAADDPQGVNADKSVGGKRGNPAAGSSRAQNVLQTGTSHPRFHGPASLAAPAASEHPHAVTATTNADGKAAVVLMPSRLGGDRYRVRAFIDPIPEHGEDQRSDGSEPHAVAAETGTFVVWRVLRVSKYLRWDYPGGATDPARGKCHGTLQNFDVSGVISGEYSKAWLDVIVEDKAKTPQLIDQATWRSAFQHARSRVSVNRSIRYDRDALLPDTTATAGVHNASAGFVRIRTAADYDAAAKGAPPPGGWQSAAGNTSFLRDMAGVMLDMAEEMMDFFTHDAISGLTILQSPIMSSLEIDVPNATLHAATEPSDWAWSRSGWGGMRRGCYVAFGENTYKSASFPYDHNRNAMHETGHTLYCPHQYTDAADVNTGPGGKTGGQYNEHDYHDLCIMGYMTLRPGGDFCGRCVLLFAGFDTHAMPTNAPGP